MKTYMTREEVMEYFGIKSTTLNTWEKDGLIVIKVNRKIFYKDTDLEKYLDGKRHLAYVRS